MQLLNQTIKQKKKENKKWNTIIVQRVESLALLAHVMSEGAIMYPRSQFLSMFLTLKNTWNSFWVLIILKLSVKLSLTTRGQFILSSKDLLGRQKVTRLNPDYLYFFKNSPFIWKGGVGHSPLNSETIFENFIKDLVSC